MSKESIAICGFPLLRCDECRGAAPTLLCGRSRSPVTTDQALRWCYSVAVITADSDGTRFPLTQVRFLVVPFVILVFGGSDLGCTDYGDVISQLALRHLFWLVSWCQAGSERSQL